MTKNQGTRKDASKNRVIKDSEDQKKPPLRISHIVCGREKRANRVYYLVDAKAKGQRRKSPNKLFCTGGEGECFPGSYSVGLG